MEDEDTYITAIFVVMAIVAVWRFIVFAMVSEVARRNGDAVTDAYMVTVYTDRGVVLRRWAGIDKVTVEDSGAIQFFDDDGNTVIFSPGCDVVVEWIGDPDE